MSIVSLAGLILLCTFPPYLFYFTNIFKRTRMNIFVGNLNARTTAQHLSRLFFQFGKVFSVRLVINDLAGSACGSAFVEMENRSALIAIRELDGVNFMNHFLEIAEASPGSSDVG